MREPQKGDVVPFLADDLGPTRKIGLLLFDDVETIDYGPEQERECWLYGRLLRRYYFEGRDALVIDDDDQWTENRYAVSLDDVLPPMPIEYREDFWAVSPEPDEVAR